jgi:HTH-type transcriptional regulator, transcriptional repressor of NAD biosynthesis genes
VKEYQTGTVIGKFYPPHYGHHYLIDTAISMCEELFVLICWKPEQTIPVQLRSTAIAEIHPTVKIIEVEDKLSDDDTLGWANNTIKILGRRPDVVFTSEDYGVPYAQAMGSKHIMVDRNRIKMPCSGTMIRANPLEFLDWVSPAIRSFYVLRICIVGAESTGKTTLAQKLAEHYKTTWVQEYGREYCEEKWKNGTITEEWHTSEFLLIANEQCRREDIAARNSSKVLICDTDALATSIWHERYLKTSSAEIQKIAHERQYSLYLLTGDEIPFVQDGLRDGEHIRHWMHNRFIEVLNETDRSWVLVHGSIQNRISDAIHSIDRLLENTHKSTNR